jgi:hypothetical protein
MAARRGVLRQSRSSAVRKDASEAAAAPFLAGMQTPPPSGGARAPHWELR